MPQSVTSLPITVDKTASGVSIITPAPIAAAAGADNKNICCAPACASASTNACRTTELISQGVAIITVGRLTECRIALLIK